MSETTEQSEAGGIQSADAKEVAVPSGNGAGSKKAVQMEQTAQELATHIDALRSSLTDMVDAFRNKLEAELIHLSSAARGESSNEDGSRRLPQSTMRKMLDQIKEIEIKPKKGRAKDFQRLQDVVAELVELLPAEK